MLCRQSTLLLQGMLAAWLDMLKDLRHEKELESIHTALLELEVKHEEKARRMLGAMLGRQSTLLLQGVLAAWLELMDTLQHEKELDHLRDELLMIKAKNSESLYRSMSAMMNSSLEQF